MNASQPPSATSGSGAYCPDLADIVWLAFDPQSGSEQAGRRPALVLTPRSYNQRVGLCVVSPITSKAKGYPFEEPVPAGLPINGTVLCDQTKSLSWRTRNAAFVCVAPRSLVDAVRLKIKLFLQIP